MTTLSDLVLKGRERRSFCMELDLESPRFAVGLESFAAPAIRVFCNVAEGPANLRSVGKFSFLYDFFATPATDKFSANAVVRIEPVHSPGLDRRIVNPNRCAEPIRKLRRLRPAI